MHIWHHHKMPVAVWIFIHNHVCAIAPVQDKVISVLLFSRLHTKQAFRVFPSKDVFHSPRRPECFHTAFSSDSSFFRTACASSHVSHLSRGFLSRYAG